MYGANSSAPRGAKISQKNFPRNSFSKKSTCFHKQKRFFRILGKYFFGFYFLPILIVEFLNIGFRSFFNKYFKNFFFALVVFIFLSQTNLLNYLSEYTIAGGAILKINYLIQKNNFLLLLVFSSIGFSIIIRFFKEDAKNNIVILLPMLIIYGFPKLLYQEYVEPLILITFFLALNTNLHKIYFKNIFSEVPFTLETLFLQLMHVPITPTITSSYLTCCYTGRAIT